MLTQNCANWMMRIWKITRSRERDDARFVNVMLAVGRGVSVGVQARAQSSCHQVIGVDIHSTNSIHARWDEALPRATSVAPVLHFHCGFCCNFLLHHVFSIEVSLHRESFIYIYCNCI